MSFISFFKFDIIFKHMLLSFFFKKKNNDYLKGLLTSIIIYYLELMTVVNLINQSLDMLNIYSDLGVQKLITTPHIYKDLYPNTKHNIEIAYTLLHEASKNQSIDLIGYGAEYMVDEFFYE